MKLSHAYNSPDLGVIPSAPRREQILVVEDEPIVRDLLCMILERLGHRIIAAANTAEAMRLWSIHREEVHLVITDYQLPDGTGLQLIERFRRQNPEVRAILCTGYYLEDIKPLPVGPEPGYLAKPFKLRRLEEAIREQIGAPPPVAASRQTRAAVSPVDYASASSMASAA